MIKTRVYVPMTADTRQSLQALADARNGSLAAVCEELLEQCAPVALQMANALQMAKSAPARGMREALEVLESQLAAADQLMLDMSPKATCSRKKTG
jgi:hypothetical protein